MGGYDFNIAASATSGANAGAGDFLIYGGGTKKQQTIVIAGAILGLLGFIAWLVLRK